MKRLIPRSAAVWGLFFAFALLGCSDGGNKTVPKASGDSKATADLKSPDLESLTANQIWKSVLATYAKANAYSDQGVLYVSYKLMGDSMQEPKPWSVSFDRQRGYSMRLFNSKIAADNERVSCYVYDISSGNLDDQCIVRPRTKAFLGGLTEDPIALHFLSGSNDLPVARKDSFELIPPALSLLEPDSRHPWLTQPNRVERFQDGKVDDVECFVVRLQGDSPLGPISCDVWIDQRDFKIWQMLLPTEFLSDELKATEGITQLQLIARFNDAQFASEPIEPLKEVSSATLVQSFVKIPESLPSELIGQPANPFVLTQPDRISWTNKNLEADHTLLVWGVGRDEKVQQIARQLKQLASHSQKMDSILVLTDGQVIREANEFRVHEGLAEATRGINWMYDPDLNASVALRIDQVPALLVLNREGCVVYGRKLGDAQWGDEVRVALDRLSRGEDVAQEMLDEYKKFLEGYNRRLVNETEQTKIQLARFGRPSKSNRAATRLKWKQEEVSEPGNFAVNAAGNLVLLDGWQSVVELDQNGQILSRAKLPVPGTFAANRIRSHSKGWFAVFQGSGKQLLLFDSNWKQLAVIPPNGEDWGPMSDAVISTHETSQQNGLLVSFVKRGIYDVATNGKTQRLLKNGASSFTSNLFMGINNGRLFRWNPGEAPRWANADLDSQQRRFQRWRTIQDDLNGYWGVAENTTNQPEVVFLDAQGKIRTNFELPNFEVETESELLSQTAIAESKFSGILIGPREIQLLQNEIIDLGILSSSTDIAGFKLFTVANKVRVVVSTNGKVECHELEIDSTH